MARGVSIKLVSYDETIPKLLKLLKLDSELKNHDHIILKPTINEDPSKSTPLAFVDAVLKFCALHKRPEGTVSIAEGSEGVDTSVLFEEQGYRALAEKYNIGLVDLNRTECESIGKNEFVGFEQILYPSVLKDSFVISIPSVRQEEGQFHGALANMRGAFPARYYQGIFSRRKNKLDAYPFKYQVHDINVTKMPNFALIELKDKGVVLAGHPLEMDKQAATLQGMDWRSVGHLRMLDETTNAMAQKQAELEAAKKAER